MKMWKRVLGFFLVFTFLLPSGMLAADDTVKVKLTRQKVSNSAVAVDIRLENLPKNATGVQLTLHVPSKVKVKDTTWLAAGNSYQHITGETVSDGKDYTFYLVNKKEVPLGTSLNFASLSLTEETANYANTISAGQIKVVDQDLTEADYPTSVTLTDASSNTGGGGGGGSSSRATPTPTGNSNIVTVPDKTPAPSATPDPNQSVFPDIAGHWAEVSIVKMALKGIIKGYEDGTFLPQNPVRRSEFSVMIGRIFPLQRSGGNSAFSDVPEGQWFTDAVMALYDHNIVNGRGDGTFGIGDNIRNQEIAVMLVRILDQQGVALTKTREYAAFADEADIDAYAKEAVVRLYEAGIINGTDLGTYNPKGDTTRAQAAALCDRIMTLAGK